MAIRESEVINVETEKGTPGGNTYWVEHPDWIGDEFALCYRKVKNGDYPDSRCAYEAGHGTWHKGEGACRFHGGLAGRHVKTGKEAGTSRAYIKRKVDDYLATGDREGMLDLSYELATMRVLFQELLETFPEPGDKTYSANIQRAVAMIQATGSLVDKISRIDSRNTITAAQVLYLRVAMAEIMIKYIPDISKRERAMAELMNMIPGGEGDQETRMVVIQ